jgi:tetratricopeptide (TPR) repeat protein
MRPRLLVKDDTGKTVAQAQAEFALETRFSDLVGSPGFEPQIHYASVAEMWKEVTGQASAARAVWALIDEGADEATVREILAERESDRPDYFFSENEFNAYGYTFLQQGEIDKAIKMFRINVNLYPESWNVYDSLGEALLAAGKTDDAVAMYEKSIALNPENVHGQEVLEEIRSSASM